MVCVIVSDGYAHYIVHHAAFLNTATHVKLDEVALWELAKLLHEGVHTRAFFCRCVHDNPHSQALQNGITAHRHNFLHMRSVRRIDALQSAVICLLFVGAIGAWY